jgi:hypothetical protein
MDKDSAKRLVQETLQDSFNKERFVYLIKNILNHIEESTFTYKGNLIFDDFADSIQHLERIGKYKDPSEKLIDILIVQLAKDTSLERARTMQRNFVAKYLKGSRGGVLKDAALVAFVAPNGKDWRFSLVKMEYKFKETPSGRVKVEEEFTPARRYSFLVGKNENSHTAQSRLLPFLLDDKTRPTLEDLENAFSVEPVTKEFFEKYRELFLRLKDALDEVVEKDSKVKADFKEKNIDTADFAKKLLGQIVFLYFLQKKGWFGVERGKEWGSGSKHFLRELFEKKHGDYKNFFNDILEPLFYEALRLERPGDYYSRFDCRIPFLNGGLFDPLNNYDWVNIDILLPNELFSNNYLTKTGDTGDGILDVFDRYNFTVKEDEPLEKEVAVDPEMLGKVFENLLEVKDRKSKGTYYTPREIVHYMCQESLVNYLATELEGKVSKEDIETLIKYGETVVEHDSRVASEGRETERYSFKLPESIRKQAKLIDEKIASIRVCDPAVGSGAFPVGMMNEIVRTRTALTPYIGKDGNRTHYHFKRHAIQNCLYGVDIDPGAVEIAKLRLWLSLVVDEESRETVQPLPNLDYKIMQGNSLIELITDNITADNERNKLVRQMKRLKDELFNATSPQAKQKIKNEIDQLIHQLFEYDRTKEIENLRQKIQLIKSQGKLFEDKKTQAEDEKKIRELEDKIKDIEKIKVPGPSEHFEWHINFSEVFAEKGGFDVVIANPPYVQLQKAINDKQKYADLYKNCKYETFDRMGDIYCLFYEKGVQIAREKGLLTFISSNKWMRAGYGEKLRAFFIKYNPLVLIDLGPNVFETATVDTNILIIQKATNANNLRGVTISDNKKNNLNLSEYVKNNAITLKNLTNNAWFIGSDAEQRLKEKIERIGKPLKEWDVNIYYGIKTGLNEAFIITTEKRNEILANCKTEEERKRTEAIIKPILRGRDIKRYYYEWAGLWLIWSYQGIDIEKFPSIKQHLIPYKKELEKRTGGARKLPNGELFIPYKWYELQVDSAAHIDEFEKEKVVYSETIKIYFDSSKNYPRFSYSSSEFYLDKTTFFLSGNNQKYFLGFLNSNIGEFLLENGYCIKLGVGSRGLQKILIEKIPIPPITSSNEPIVRQIEALVDKILAAKKENKSADTTFWEREIDGLVYKLYALTEEEVRIIEESPK